MNPHPSLTATLPSGPTHWLWLTLMATLGGCASAPQQTIVLPTEVVATPSATATPTGQPATVAPVTTAAAVAPAARPPVASSTAGEAQTFVPAGAR